ncbi:hypothetical protein ACILDT_11335 [Capnocytophaga canis]|uniref:hypothetical protein n=1 Tax=Capnocytophaga canis TaxID=1848903 RepID=UPI0037CCFFB9
MEDNRITIPIKASVAHFLKQTLKAFFISAVVAFIFCALISFLTAKLRVEYFLHSKGYYLKDAFGGSVYIGGSAYSSRYSSTLDSIRFDDMLKLLAEEEFIFAWFITFLVLFGIWMFVLIVKTFRRNFRIQLTGNESFNERRTVQNGGYTGSYNGGHNQQNMGYSSRSQNEEY